MGLRVMNCGNSSAGQCISLNGFMLRNFHPAKANNVRFGIHMLRRGLKP